MSYLGDFAVNATVNIYFTTHDQAGGSVAPSDAFENADVRIYKNGSATERASVAGVTMTSPFDAITGLHMLAIDTSNDTDAGFYAAGSTYTVVLSPDTETVDTKTVVRVLAQFSIGRPLAATHQAASNAALVANKLDHLVAVAESDDPVDGSILARLAASDGDWSGFVPADDALEALRDRGDSGWQTASGFATAVKLLAYVQLLARKDAAIAADRPTEVAEINNNEGSGAGAYANTTDSQEAVRDNVGTPAGASVSADVAAVKADTGNLISRITATLFTGITSLANWLRGIGRKDAMDATAKAELNTGGGAYNEATDSQEAIRDRGDAAWVTGNIVVPDAAGTAAGLHAATNGLIAGLNNLSQAQAQAAATAALNAYDPPTNAEMVARTRLAAEYALAVVCTDARLARLDAAVSTRATPAQVRVNAGD